MLRARAPKADLETFTPEQLRILTEQIHVYKHIKVRVEPRFVRRSFYYQPLDMLFSGASSPVDA